jgi:hypothetical protein
MEEMSGDFDFDSLDPLDFGEPTAETRQNFRKTLDKIRSIASIETRPARDIIQSLSVSAFTIIDLDSLCPITKYSYSQNNDPRYSFTDENYLQYVEFDIPQDYREAWKKVLGSYVTCKMFFQNPNIEANYEKTDASETLYIAKPIPPEITIQSPEFPRIMQQRALDLVTSLANGSALSTEGSMRRFLTELNQDLETRI